MNNVLPRSVKMHYKYDLKGSTYKRRASRKEREKACPTHKDLDFQDMHEEGLYFDAETYTNLMKTLQRDCRVGGSQQCVCVEQSFLFRMAKSQQEDKLTANRENNYQITENAMLKSHSFIPLCNCNLQPRRP